MNKSNKILVGVLAFLVVCVVGYALFSETITVTGTATASGNFNLTPTCSLTMPSSWLEEKEGGYTNPECLINDNVITSKVTLQYPTALKLFYTEYKNDGDIDAVIKFKYDVPESFVNIKPTIKVYNNKTNELVKTLDKFDKNYVQLQPAKFAIKTVDGNYLETEEQIVTKNRVYKDTAGDYYIDIKPGESFVFLYMMTWHKDAVDNENYSTAEMSLELQFIQKTEDLKINTDGTGPELCHMWC